MLPTRHPYVVAGAVLLVTLILLLAVDAFSPVQLPRGFQSPSQLVGVDLLLLLLPPYLICAGGLATRRSARLLGQVADGLPDHTPVPAVHAPPGVVALGAAVGVVYAVAFNLPVGSVAQLLAGGTLLVVLVGCMIFVWLVVGVLLSSRLHVAEVFNRVGREVPIDPYDHTSLEPFARTGSGDMLVVVGALVLTTVQSIDATIRYENYLYALIVALPAALYLLLRPMVSVHRRLQRSKAAELAAVNALIREASRALRGPEMAQLELLLQRRERIQALYTWPINVSMVSRLLLYGVIPPAAWVAAALVETLVEKVIGG